MSVAKMTTIGIALWASGVHGGETASCWAMAQTFQNGKCCDKDLEANPYATADVDCERLQSIETLVGSLKDSVNPTQKKFNVLWMLIDDVSTERFPESGNEALKGKLPGIQELRDDGAIYYSNLYAPSSICAPAQAALFSGMDPGAFGAHNQFAGDRIPGLGDYRAVPPPEVEFMPETLRKMGYYATGAGKLDYQVGDVMPTFYNEITGGFLVDTLSPAVFDRIADPAIALDRPFFSMLNFMDVHQFLTAMQVPPPIPLTDPATGLPPTDLPFGQFGYTNPHPLKVKKPDGTFWYPPAPAIDFLTADIVGYSGAMNISKLTHANGGVPGYLPEDTGIKAILAKEYDMLRNLDYRVQKVVKMLKDKGVYDDTLIVLFGDHGSGTYKAKVLMELQSMHTPMWIKLPKGVRLPDTVTKDTAGQNIDNSLVQLQDLLPTTLSVLGVRPPAHATGRALAGAHTSHLPPRQTVFSSLNRLGSRSWKTHVAISKDFVYQVNQVNGQVVEELEDATWMTDEIADSIEYNAEFASHFSLFAKSPSFTRLQRLIRAHADDASFGAGFKHIAADGSKKPVAALYDRRVDPWAVDNLLYKRVYTVNRGATQQAWGNNVINVTMKYAAPEHDLEPDQLVARGELHRSLRAWIDTQPHNDWEADHEHSHSEENRYAEAVWPGGVQPNTAEPVLADSDGGFTLILPTKGALARHAVVDAAMRVDCAQIDTAKRAAGFKFGDKMGFDPVNYMTKTRGEVSGYVYNKLNGREVVWSWFIGREKDCTHFISADFTFMELTCPSNKNTYAWDTRDSTWNGEDWTGVNADGSWVGTPVKFANADGSVNVGAFAPYVFGPDRVAIYGAVDGVKPHLKALKLPFGPPPKYWAWNADVSTNPPFYYSAAPSLRAFAWDVSFAFENEDKNGEEVAGSLTMTLGTRSAAPSRVDSLTVAFSSYDYDGCLLWDVAGNSTMIAASQGQTVFAQAVRKGFRDSKFVEVVKA